MNELRVERQEYEPSGLHRSGAPALEPNVPDAPVRIIGPEGTPVMVIGRYPRTKLAALRSAFMAYRAICKSAGHANVSRTGGSRTDTTSFGYQAAQPLLRRSACKPCGGALIAQRHHHTICEAATDLHTEYERVLPEHADDDHARATTAIHPDWFLGESHWTSGVLNLNSPIAYHYDANNLPCWSAMVVIRREIRGGHLHVPEYGLVVPCRDGDIVYFPGYETLHSVTPMRRLSPSAYRYTAVYYTVARMAKCGPAAEQVGIAQRRRTATETGMTERQRREGLMAQETP